MMAPITSYLMPLLAVRQGKLSLQDILDGTGLGLSSPAGSDTVEPASKGTRRGQRGVGGDRGDLKAGSGKTPLLPCVSTAFVAKTPPLPCAFTAFVANTPPCLVSPRHDLCDYDSAFALCFYCLRG